jgi:C1A family cysteine protease
MNTQVKIAGWKPDLPDHRDVSYIAPPEILSNLPTSVDLRQDWPPVYDQGTLNSCTAFAIAGAYQMELNNLGNNQFVPSTLFIYFNERVAELAANLDSGACLRDGLKSLVNVGVCSDACWPYCPGEVLQKPFQSCYLSAADNVIAGFLSIACDLNTLKACLAEGHPFVFGFSMFASFSDAQPTGIIQMPLLDDSPSGSHAVVAVGYDDTSEVFIARNSFGPNWGDHGYITMPYKYLTDGLSDDFWTLRLTDDVPPQASNIVLEQTNA